MLNAAAEFLRRERQALVGYVRLRLDEAAGPDAEDVVQDVIVGLFSRPDSTEAVRDVAAYIYQALRNRISDRFRRRRETVALSDGLADPRAGPSDELEKGEALDDVFRAMDDLEPEEKAVILETEFEGKTFKELAEEWDVPLGTLLARKSRALAKLRKQLTGRSDPT